MTGLAATFPRHWGPALATRATRSAATLFAGIDLDVPFESISLSETRIGPCVLRNIPGRPSCSSITIRYTVGGLRAKRIDRIDVAGLSFDPAALDLPMPGGRGTASTPATPDPLQGWRFGALHADLPAVDLAPLFPPESRRFVPDARVALDLDARDTPGGIEATLSGSLAGGDLRADARYDPSTASGAADLAFVPAIPDLALPAPVSAHAVFAFSATNGLGVGASFSAGLQDTRWEVVGTFRSDADGFALEAELPKTSPDETDPLLAGILRLAPPMPVTDLRFHGEFSAKASVSKGARDGLPAWTASADIRDLSLGGIAGDRAFAVEGARLPLKVAGLGNRWTLVPFHPGFESASFGSFSFGKGRMHMLVEEQHLFITQASVGFCDGFIRLYALSFNLEKLATGFTIFLDDLDAGQILAGFPKFRGSASGRLHGKIPLFYDLQGNRIRLGKAFLYSPPGAGGKLRIEDSREIVANLALAGVPGETRNNLGRALADLDYSVLRFDLTKDPDGQNTMEVQLRGTSQLNRQSVPVDLRIAFHGQLETLVNFGIQMKSGPSPAAPRKPEGKPRP